jgi:hypothetical protein
LTTSGKLKSAQMPALHSTEVKAVNKTYISMILILIQIDLIKCFSKYLIETTKYFEGFLEVLLQKRKSHDIFISELFFNKNINK